MRRFPEFVLAIPPAIICATFVAIAWNTGWPFAWWMAVVAGVLTLLLPFVVHLHYRWAEYYYEQGRSDSAQASPAFLAALCSTTPVRLPDTADKVPAIHEVAPGEVELPQQGWDELYGVPLETAANLGELSPQRLYSERHTRLNAELYLDEEAVEPSGTQG